MDTWLLVTAYRKSPPPYLMAPSPTSTSYVHSKYRMIGLP